MDALSARVAGLPSGPALVSTLKASILPPDAQEAVAAAVVAVLAEASAGGAFFCLRWVCVGFAPRWKDWHPLAAARGRVYRCAARNMSSLACVGDIGVAITFRRCARIVSLALSLARAPSAASTFPLSPSPSKTHAAPGKENGGAPSPPASAPVATDLAAADCILPGLTLTHPRATFTAAFFGKDRRLVLSASFKAPGAATATPRELAIPATAIASVAVIEDVPEDAGAVLLLLALKGGADGGGGAPAATWGKAALSTLAIRLAPGAASDVAWGSGPDAPRLAGHTAVVLCQALGRLGVPPPGFDAPSPATFRAVASTAGGGCAVGAAVGAAQGYVFPLARGLAFAGRPPALVPLAGVWQAVLGRARGGGAASFDLILIPKKKKKEGGGGDGGAAGKPKKVKPLEFSSLPKAELGVVQAWLFERGVGVVLAGDEGAAAAGEEEEEEEEEEETREGEDKAGATAAGADEDEKEEGGSSEEDSDFQPGSSSSDGDRSEPTDGSGGSGSGGGSSSEEEESDGDSGSASLGSGDDDGDGEASEGEGGGPAAKRARGE